ncbi:MAG: hypothetical protein HQ592_12220 [Planctomycetes bacterium]|nr:hypothetical protein [Planctomycetota bacterium]
MKEGYGKIRRFYLGHFRKRYVQKVLELRRGECRRCGNCCTVMFRCPQLEGDAHCTLYHTRSLQCRLFPIDARDLRGRFSSCGYYFVDEVEGSAEQEEAIQHSAQSSGSSTTGSQS